MDLLLHNLRTIGTHHCDHSVGEEAAQEIERLRAAIAYATDRQNYHGSTTNSVSISKTAYARLNGALGPNGTELTGAPHNEMNEAMNTETPRTTNEEAGGASDVERVVRREQLIGEALKMAIHSYVWGTKFDLEQAEHAYAVYMGFVDD